MNELIYIFTIFSLAFLIKEVEGPWGIVSNARNWLMKEEHVGVFFYKLLSCYYCLGCWCGAIVYLLSQDEWHVNLLICWGLAGGIISLTFDRVMVKLSAPDPKPTPVKNTRKKTTTSI
jgi:hypothetical protein